MAATSYPIGSRTADPQTVPKYDDLVHREVRTHRAGAEIRRDVSRCVRSAIPRPHRKYRWPRRAPSRTAGATPSGTGLITLVVGLRVSRKPIEKAQAGRADLGSPRVRRQGLEPRTR